MKMKYFGVAMLSVGLISGVIASELPLNSIADINRQLSSGEQILPPVQWTYEYESAFTFYGIPNVTPEEMQEISIVREKGIVSYIFNGKNLYAERNLMSRDEYLKDNSTVDILKLATTFHFVWVVNNELSLSGMANKRNELRQVIVRKPDSALSQFYFHYTVIPEIANHFNIATTFSVDAELFQGAKDHDEVDCEEYEVGLLYSDQSKLNKDGLVREVSRNSMVASDENGNEIEVFLVNEYLIHPETFLLYEMFVSMESNSEDGDTIIRPVTFYRVDWTERNGYVLPSEIVYAFADETMAAIEYARSMNELKRPSEIIPNLQYFRLLPEEDSSFEIPLVPENVSKVDGRN